ncbi:MAG: hypothetical protein Q9162_001139 [Coniocarpon cinnabarinum]
MATPARPIDPDDKQKTEELLSSFQYEKLLNQDQAGRRLILLGHIDSHPAILLIQRAAFSTSDDFLRSFTRSLSRVQNLSGNDIYAWYLGWSSAPSHPKTQNAHDVGQLHSDDAVPERATEDETNRSKQADWPHDLKLDLIYPCTPKHIAKYATQSFRTVTETPEIYARYIKPYMAAQREAGRLNWVFNILDGKTEQEDVMLRSPSQPETSRPHAGSGEDEGFLLMPDLNWDRHTLSSLHLLVLVNRRDIWSVRDLKKRHIPWLRTIRAKVLDSTTKLYPSIQKDELKLYMHYQPTYYHLHVHVVHVMLEAGGTQAVGKALGFEDVIDRLQIMEGDADTGMERASLTYGLGMESELWKVVFGPLKRGEVPIVES